MNDVLEDFNSFIEQECDIIIDQLHYFNEVSQIGVKLQLFYSLNLYLPFFMLDYDIKEQIISDITQKCYDAAINKCYAENISYINNNNILFKYYNKIIYRLLINLSADSHLFQNDTIDKLINGNISCDKLINMNAYELCPKHTEQDFDLLKTRNKIISYKEYSLIYSCSQCNEKKIIVDRYQSRKGDEGETIKLRCDACGFVK